MSNKNRLGSTYSFRDQLCGVLLKNRPAFSLGQFRLINPYQGGLIDKKGGMCTKHDAVCRYAPHQPRDSIGSFHTGHVKIDACRFGQAAEQLTTGFIVQQYDPNPRNSFQ